MGCGKLHFKGIRNTVVNQGAEYDLTEGVTAYDADGNEVPFSVEPEELDTCVVGLHKVEYTAFGEDSSLIPSVCTPRRGNNGIRVADFCNMKMLKKERQIFVTQAMPPRISGLTRVNLVAGAPFNPITGVTAEDDNGNPAEVTYHGVYDDSAEGNPAFFETDLANPLKSVKVTIEPTQDGTPWMSDTVDTAPYLFRQSAGGEVDHSYNSEFDKIVGGTVAWNQLIQNGNFADASVWTKHNEWDISNNKATFTASASAFYSIYQRINVIANHKYYVGVTVSGYSATGNPYEDRISLDPTFGNYPSALKDIAGNGRYEGIREVDDTASWYIGIKVQLGSNQSLTQSVSDFVCIDLTAMFGTVIADYVYSLEQATAGSGIAWLKSYGFFTKNYYPYNVGELVSVKPSAHKIVGCNYMNPTSIVRQSYNATVGNPYTTSPPTAVVSGTNPINVAVSGSWDGASFVSEKLAYGRTYYFMAKISSSVSSRVRATTYLLDDNKVIVKKFANYTSNYNIVIGFTPNENERYFVLSVSSNTASTDITVSDLCLNVSDANINGTYEPYIEHIYPLDDSTEYRGLFKLDANNNLYADGDVYEPDGTVNRRYGVVNLGAVDWNYTTSTKWFYRTFTDAKPTANNTIVANVLAQDRLTYSRNSLAADLTIPKGVSLNQGGVVQIRDLSYDDPIAFKTAMNDVYLVYELATPTAEQATPFISPQWVSPLGTEEYIDTRDVQIPVGHSTRYADIYAINGTSEVNVSHLSGNLLGGDALHDALMDAMPTATDNVGERLVSFSFLTPSEKPITDGMTFKENTSYTFIYKMWRGSSPTSGLRLYYKDGTYVNMPSPHDDYTTERVRFVSSDEKTIDYLEHRIDGSSVSIYYDGSGIFEGDIELSEFEPYQITTYNTDFSGEAYDPVYGGTLDLITGELIVDRIIVGGSDWVAYAYSNGYTAYRVSGLIAKYASANMNKPISNLITEFGSFSSSSMNKNIIQPATNVFNVSFMALKDDVDATTVWFSYLILEPITYQLDPVTINAIVGGNNIETDAVSVWVRFEKNIPTEGSFAYPLEGSYEITYEAEDQCGNIGTATREINVTS